MVEQQRVYAYVDKDMIARMNDRSWKIVASDLIKETGYRMKKNLKWFAVAKEYVGRN